MSLWKLLYKAVPRKSGLMSLTGSKRFCFWTSGFFTFLDCMFFLFFFWRENVYASKKCLGASENHFQVSLSWLQLSQRASLKTAFISTDCKEYSSLKGKLVKEEYNR